MKGKNKNKAKLNESAASYNKERYFGPLKSMYMRIMLAFFVAVVIATTLTAIIVYSLRLGELNNYINKQMIMDAQKIRNTVDFYNESQSIEDKLTDEQLQELVSLILMKDYDYLFMSNFDEVRQYFNDADIDKYEDAINREEFVIISNALHNNRGLMKVNNTYIVINIVSNSRSDVMGMLYSVVWTSAIVTVLLALILNSFAVSWIIKPVKHVSDAMQEVTEGNYKVRVKVEGTDEVALLQKNFNKMAEGLSANEDMSRSFISTVSHEYKTPLAAISGYAKLLYDGGLTEEEQKEYIKIILEQSKRLKNLSVDMLQLSRLDSNTAGIKKDYFSLDEQIRKVILVEQHLWDSKNIALDIDLDSVVIYANEQMIYHVWENLLSNAIKFVKKDTGEIKISLHKENGAAVFRIKDNGCGIKDSDKDKIFEKFFKSDADCNTGGNGLGLPIIKKIVELSNGKISFTSEYNVGTEFIVTLPLE